MRGKAGRLRVGEFDEFTLEVQLDLYRLTYTVSETGRCVGKQGVCCGMDLLEVGRVGERLCSSVSLFQVSSTVL